MHICPVYKKKEIGIFQILDKQCMEGVWRKLYPHNQLLFPRFDQKNVYIAYYCLIFKTIKIINKIIFIYFRYLVIV